MHIQIPRLTYMYSGTVLFPYILSRRRKSGCLIRFRLISYSGLSTLAFYQGSVEDDGMFVCFRSICMICTMIL